MFVRVIGACVSARARACVSQCVHTARPATLLQIQDTNHCSCSALPDPIKRLQQYLFSLLGQAAATASRQAGPKVAQRCEQDPPLTALLYLAALLQSLAPVVV